MKGQATIHYLALYSKDCLTCASFVEGATQRHMRCHHSRGNTECPASEVKITFAGRTKRWAALVQAARSRRDAKREADIMARVEKLSPAERSRFYDFLESK